MFLREDKGIKILYILESSLGNSPERRKVWLGGGEKPAVIWPVSSQTSTLPSHIHSVIFPFIHSCRFIHSIVHSLNKYFLSTYYVPDIKPSNGVSKVKLTHWKRLWCWEGLAAGGEGDDRGWDGWMASLTRWTWVWVNSGSWWWTGRPGVLWFMGLQSVGHEWATELNWR